MLLQFDSLSLSRRNKCEKFRRHLPEQEALVHLSVLLNIYLLRVQVTTSIIADKLLNMHASDSTRLDSLPLKKTMAKNVKCKMH